MHQLRQEFKRLVESRDTEDRRHRGEVANGPGHQGAQRALALPLFDPFQADRVYREGAAMNLLPFG